MKYEIDFGGHLLAVIEVNCDKINVLSAMDGWGNPVPQNNIAISSVEEGGEE